MATQQTRPFSRDYSGLVTQSALALCIAAVAIVWHDIMKRKRRLKKREEPLGSVETWEFGYLYQGRSWAKNPSPPHPRGWPLSWIKPVMAFPELKLHELRGTDAALYCRFLRGCFWFTFVHTFTTAPILLPIHLEFSDNEYSSRSMNRALISSLVTTPKGLSLLWIHLCLLCWLTISWICTLLWICRGAFRFRAMAIADSTRRARAEAEAEDSHYNPHPHPQHPFHSMPPLGRDGQNRGLRLRTIMVTNIPSRLRSEKELKEYFEYYMSRPLAKPSLGLTSAAQPGFINKCLSFLFNRAKKMKILSSRSSHSQNQDHGGGTLDDAAADVEAEADERMKPIVERIVMVRKMTELASLLDRREDILRKLETAHIKLAKKTLTAVKVAMDRQDRERSTGGRSRSRMKLLSIIHREVEDSAHINADVERGEEVALTPEGRMDLLIRRLSPYVDQFDMRGNRSLPKITRKALIDRLSRISMGHINSPRSSGDEFDLSKSLETDRANINSSSKSGDNGNLTIWEVLFSLPRTTLDPYQPLVHLSALFRGKTVPAIDYYTAKLGLLTSLITENRSRAIGDFEPVSTAFVTFADPDDARRACKYLVVHPKNPLACLVTMAPDYEDLDWMRLMKSTFRAELVKDWVVDLGVWAFTIAWVIPVSLLVALVTIQNIASVIPGLKAFLDKHPYLEEVISSFLPTLLTSLLMLLIPLILLLIAKKANTFTTLSALHDRIMTRYHKFLVANILVFFCVGVSALESFFTSFKSSLNTLQVVGGSFPTAGPFYVGWLIFTTAIHAGLELGLFGLPLILYPFTKRQITPRKRSVGIRPRTFNYYYWLPNHILVVTVSLVFYILNPLLIPFTLIYFAVENVVVKNQLLHVYAKIYEGNGQLLLIRLVRYSLDGLILSQIIFLALMVVLKRKVHVGFTAVILAFTILVKILLTRMCRAKYEEADITEARIVSGTLDLEPLFEPEASRLTENPAPDPSRIADFSALYRENNSLMKFRTWKHPKAFFNFSYSAAPPGAGHALSRRKPNPFTPAGAHLPHGPLTNEVPISPFSDQSEVCLVAGPPLSSSPILTPSRSDEPLNHLRDLPLVTPHEKHPTWDDSARLDRPYDNPYFVRPITNHLWLPRNPVGTLDLDDTVNVFRSLTCEPSAGQLGEWLEHGIALADLPSTFASSEPSIRANSSSGRRRDLNGTEDIALPSAIATRIETLEGETDVDHAGDRSPSLFRNRRPSNFTIRPSNGHIHRFDTSVGRRSTFDVSPGLGIRSISAASANPRFRQASFTSQISTSRTALTNQDPASLPDVHAQARFAGSRFSLATHISDNVTAEPEPQRQPPTPVSTREAVVGEVIAEEYQATEDRIRKEEAEMKEAGGSRSWLTSWMFSHIPWTS